MKHGLCLVLVFTATPLTWAHDVFITGATYYRDVQPILARRCSSCHGPISALPLETYAQVRTHILSIRQQVLSRNMPPWGAVKGFGHFEPEDALSLDEIGTITGWIMGGAHEGKRAASTTTPPSHPDVPSPPIKATSRLLIQTRSTLQRELNVVAIQPLSEQTVDSAKITAEMPDGSIEPLVWLFQYPGTAHRTFRLLHSLVLPAGTTVTSSAPLQFELEATASKPAR